ncbi:5-formyltetrahydrofolate cyclo-ligase [Nanoarchaeota archaeon]
MKQRFRLESKDRTSGFSFQEKAGKSRLITEQLESLDEFKSSQDICIYVSKSDEVQTHELIINMLGNKNVLVPLTQEEGLKIVQLKSFEELNPGAFGILEPPNREEHIGEPDMIITPGQAFDVAGYRLGRGLGYYDKYLKNLEAIKVGLTFDENLLDEVPTEEHDVPMDIIITDKRVLRFDT